MLRLLPLILFLMPLAAQESGSGYFITLDPEARVSISARIASPVSKIHKKLGDSFAKGDVLLELKEEIFYANLLKTQADYERAQTKLDIKKELFAEESASLFEIKEAEAELATAYAEMVTARDNYNETKVIAPFDGKVSTVYVEEFELPKAGEPLIEIIDDKKLKARFLISSKTPLKLGDQIAIKLSETGKMIRATVTRLSPDIDPSSGTLKVEAEIDNKEGKLLAGMTGRAFIPKEPSNEPR